MIGNACRARPKARTNAAASTMAVGPWQIVVIALVILLLFGASRLADIGKGVGEGIRNFKKGLSDEPEGDAKGSDAEARTERKA